jgi:hypothetical protein
MDCDIHADGGRFLVFSRLAHMAHLGMIPLNTIKTLRAWAAWGCGHSLDYPSMSPMFGERALKSPLYSSDYAPPDVYRMELTVCRLEPYDRGLIIQRWQRRASYREMAKFFHVSTYTVSRDLRVAESEVSRIFDGNDCVVKHGVVSVCLAQ